MSRLAASSAVGLAEQKRAADDPLLARASIEPKAERPMSVAVAYDVLDKRSQLDLADVAAGVEGLESVGRLAHLESIVHLGRFPSSLRGIAARLSGGGT